MLYRTAIMLRGDGTPGFFNSLAQSLRRFIDLRKRLATNSPGDDIVKQKTILEELLALMAQKFRMLSDPTRLAILRCMMEGNELNVSQLVASTGRELANVSKHLKQLADARLLSRRKVGSFVLYRLADPVLEKICELVCDSLQRDLEAELKKNKKLLGKER